MVDRICKAYRVAWLWPTVYSVSPLIIWLSRAIVFLLPPGLMVLTILTGAPLYGIVAASAIAAVTGCALIYATVRMFYKEYESVEEFSTRDARLKEFFHGFPSYTDIPLTEYEPNVWVAYGHIDHEEMRAGIRSVITAAEGTFERFTTVAYTYISTQTFARFTNPASGHWSEGIEICKPSAHGAFPITRVEYTKL